MRPAATAKNTAIASSPAEDVAYGEDGDETRPPFTRSVATSERGDRRDRPQTPWPLVHPPAIRVPTPTSNPATIRTGKPGLDGDRRIGSDNPIDDGRKQEPDNESEPPRDVAGAWFLSTRRQFHFIPATRPLTSTNSALRQVPMTTPPHTAPIHGVNALQSMVMVDSMRPGRCRPGSLCRGFRAPPCRTGSAQRDAARRSLPCTRRAPPVPRRCARPCASS